MIFMKRWNKLNKEKEKERINKDKKKIWWEEVIIVNSMEKVKEILIIKTQWLVIIITIQIIPIDLIKIQVFKNG